MNLDFPGGLRVVESSAFIAAPLAGMTLAQSGADVIRIAANDGPRATAVGRERSAA